MRGLCLAILVVASCNLAAASTAATGATATAAGGTFPGVTKNPFRRPSNMQEVAGELDPALVDTTILDSDGSESALSPKPSNGETTPKATSTEVDINGTPGPHAVAIPQRFRSDSAVIPQRYHSDW
jgi:hypothetical protein